LVFEDREDTGTGKKSNRGKVLDQIIEEVYETYGGDSEEGEEDSSEFTGRLHMRRAQSQVELTRPKRSLLTQSSGATSPVTIAAVQFIKEFEQSRIELVPCVMGSLYVLQLVPNKKAGKPSLRFAVLNPVLGDLTFYKTASEFQSQKKK